MIAAENPFTEHKEVSEDKVAGGQRDSSISEVSREIETTDDLVYVPKFKLNTGTGEGKSKKRATKSTSVELSDQVHVLGMDVVARYMAHSLATIPEIPPVQMLAHSPSVQRKWANEYRAIALYDKRKSLMGAQPILCPEPFDQFSYPMEDGDGRKIHNLLVTATRPGMFRALRALRHRIDSSTTLCLLDQGLGMMEQLNEEVFTKEAFRPNYVLSAMTHQIMKHNGGNLSIRKNLDYGGSFFLTPISEGKSKPPFYQNLRGILSMNSDLRIIGLHWPSLLRIKLLDKMLFASTADALSVALGLRFDQILRDRHTMTLWNQLLDEILDIITQLPEFRDKPKVLSRFTGRGLRHELRQKLARQRKESSHWIERVKNGHNTPVDSMNGYFVKRAKELGINHEINSWVTETVKARVSARRQELDQDIPLNPTPYMMDGDALGGFPGGFAEPRGSMDEDAR